MAKKKTKKKKSSAKSRLLLIVFVITAIVFYKISIVLVIGMLPTIVVAMVDKTSDKTKVMTIGFMNFAGCFPYCYQLFEKSHDTAAVLTLILNPTNIIIMYAAALLGYIIEWGVVGFVANIMVQKGRQRLVNIKKTQETLAKKWGSEVSGEVSLDANGFPIED